MAHLNGFDAPDLSQRRPVTLNPPRNKSYAEADLNPARLPGHASKLARYKRSPPPRVHVLVCFLVPLHPCRVLASFLLLDLPKQTTLNGAVKLGDSCTVGRGNWLESHQLCVLRVCCLAAHPVAVVSSFNHASCASDQHLLLTVGGDEL
ncbi:hypothetical protein PtA15_10A245 [Puccinia triticina]|uniref:Uncharacterized protein n=1 Tax=Puccinia triticina TaxID=208348 RepID=A0ABY7CV13_9BASI|nr:uncharacterized protein PtA15_10A245 [Puccinia triticina]WAQ88825.1 hypothetical protein PtA15_10A245 [Puccinia triticina]